MRIVDCDVHPHYNDFSQLYPYMPKEIREELETPQVGYSKMGRPTDRFSHPSSGVTGGGMRTDALASPGEMPASRPELVAEDLLERFSIDRAILQPLQGVASNWTDQEHANVIASANNDYFIEHWAWKDERFRVALAVSPHDIQAARQEVERHSDTRGVVGILLPLSNVVMGNPYYFDLYEIAEAEGLPVMIHPSGMAGFFIDAPWIAGGVPSSYAERHGLLRLEAQTNLVSLIFEGVFDRFPSLRIVFVELGFTWLLSTLWQLEKEWKRLKKASPLIKRDPFDYVTNHVRFSTQPLDEPERLDDLWTVMDLIDAQRVLMFSSDYPHFDTDDPDRVIKKLPNELREQICSLTALETFGDRLS